MVTHTVDQVEKSGCFRPKPIRAAICMSFAFAVTSGAFAEPLTLTWSGGETGSFSDQSWSGTAEGHLSPQDGDTLVFAGGGTFTSDIPGLEVAELRFTSSAAVTVDGDEKITVLRGGGVYSSGSGGVKILAPLQAGSDDEGDAASGGVTFAAVGNGRAITVSGVLSGSSPIGIGAAKGTVVFRGENTFTGKLSVTNGYFNALGSSALGVGTEEAYFKTGNADGGAKIGFYGVTVPMPVKNESSGNEDEIGFRYQQGIPTETVFKDVFTTTKSVGWCVDNWATVTFEKKLYVGTPRFTVRVREGSTIKLMGADSEIKDFVVSLMGSANWKGMLVVGSPLTLRSDSNWAASSPKFLSYYGTIRLETEDAFPHRPNTSVPLEWVPFEFGNDSYGNRLDMNGYSQTFTCLRDRAKKESNIITSSEDCVLRLKQDITQINPNVLIPDFYGIIGGKVSLSVEGSDPLFLCGLNTSTGDMCLTNGAFAGFSEAGSWRGTNFTASAGSTLVVSNTAVLAENRNCIISLSDSPEQETRSCLLLGDGAYFAKSMTVDGEMLHRGTWGSSESGATYVDDVHFKGPGTLRVATGSPIRRFRIMIR